MDKNEQLAQKLDEDFKLGLVAIRPFILRLTSIEDARLCRLWLDKLHDSVDERIIRNNLLKELTEHVKSGCLKQPFINPPTAYPLTFLKVGCQGDYFQEECGDEIFSVPYEDNNTPVQAIYSGYETSRESVSSDTRKVPRRRRSEPFTLTRWKESKEEKEIHQELEANETVTGDNDQIQSLINTIASLKAQNEALKQEVRLYQKTSKRTQHSLNAVNEEVVTLRAKLSELQRINSNIEKSHVSTVNEYRKTLTESLGLVSERLKELNEQNADLVKNIAQLDSKITQGDQQYEDSEGKLKKEINELKCQLTAEKKKNQMEIKHLQSIIDEKNDQLKRVDMQVKKQCSRMQEEVFNIKSEISHAASEGYLQLKAKITSLKKDVARLEKANKKLVAEYETRLRTQASGRGLEHNMRMQKFTLCKGEAVNLELEVIELEQKYRKIVADLEARAALQRKRDVQRIRDLEELLNMRKDNNNVYKAVPHSHNK